MFYTEGIMSFLRLQSETECVNLSDLEVNLVLQTVSFFRYSTLQILTSNATLYNIKHNNFQNFLPITEVWITSDPPCGPFSHAA